MLQVWFGINCGPSLDDYTSLQPTALKEIQQVQILHKSSLFQPLLMSQSLAQTYNTLFTEDVKIFFVNIGNLICIYIREYFIEFVKLIYVCFR